MAKKPLKGSDDNAGMEDAIPVPRGSVADYFRFRRAVEGHGDQPCEETTAELAKEVSRLAESVGELKKRAQEEERSAPLRPTYTVKEVAQLLGKSPDTIRRWIRLGKLRSTKTTDTQQGQHLIPYASIAPFMRGT